MPPWNSNILWDSISFIVIFILKQIQGQNPTICFKEMRVLPFYRENKLFWRHCVESPIYIMHYTPNVLRALSVLKNVRESQHTLKRSAWQPFLTVLSIAYHWKSERMKRFLKAAQEPRNNFNKYMATDMANNDKSSLVWTLPEAAPSIKALQPVTAINLHEEVSCYKQFKTQKQYVTCFACSSQLT